MEKLSCPCCIPAKEYTTPKALYKHQRSYDPNFIDPKDRKRLAYYTEPNICKQCSTIISYESIVSRSAKSFCSKSCSATFNNLARIRPETFKKLTKKPRCANRPTPRLKNCERCHQTSIDRFCSTKCASLSRSEKVLSQWLTGQIEGHCGKTLALRNAVRNYILEEANHSCCICGWNKRHPIDGKPLVEVDHIDGDASNSSIENLRVLCPNCHSETPTFRARNGCSARTRNMVVQ